jgi:hypothetical protein
MPICYKHKVIFIHIPKTAGTSIERSLGIGLFSKVNLRHHVIQKRGGVEYALQHLTHQYLKDHKLVKPHWDEYYKFSVVRHPYTRALSEYFWRIGGSKAGIGFDTTRFNNFVDKWLSPMDTDHKLPQWRYIYDKDENCVVDYVGRFENLKKTFHFLKKKLQLKTNLPLIHKSSNSKQMLNLLTKSHKDKIYNLYRKDFEIFKYKR